MNEEQLQQAKEIFEQAAERDPSEWPALLDEACAGDAEVRAEVEELLRFLPKSGEFIERPYLEDSSLVQPLAPSLEAGRLIGNYKVLEEIGRGGMGAVYRAVRADDEFSKQVAIKLVWPGFDSAEVVRRFKQERQILADLDHPNIARLLDGGTTDEGWPYVVMEYVDGAPITEYCNERKLSVNQRLQLFQQVCAAVEYAHRHLVVHRDLKPGNIFVTRDGAVKLLDFGIAKILDPSLRDGAPSLTNTGLYAMTPEYASPEQARGERITTATDVYSLGVTLYELLTGAHPFRFKTRVLHEVLRTICEEEAMRPSQVCSPGFSRKDSTIPAEAGTTNATNTLENTPDKLRRRLQGDLDNILLKALRKEPAQRYASVEQMNQDIARHLAGKPVVARKPTFAYRAGKYVRRHKAGTIGVLSLIIALMAGGAALFINFRNAEAELRRKNRELYAANIKLANENYRRGDYARARSLLAQYQPGQDGTQEDLRGFEWRYLWRLLNRDRMTLHYQSTIHAMTVSPDGKIVATGMHNGTIILRDAATGQEIITISGKGAIIRSLNFSPDGKRIVAGDAKGFASVWDTATGQALTTVQGHGNLIVCSVAFSPDGKSFATGGADKTARLWNATNGEPLLTFPGHTNWVGAVDFSPDGRLLATGGLDWKVKLWELPTGKLRATLEGCQGDIWRIQFSSDGQFIVAGAINRPAVRWRISDGRMLHTFEGTPQGSLGTRLSPDGRMLALAGNDRTLKLFDIGSRREIAAFKGHDAYVGFSAFAHDGRWLASADNKTVKIWDIESALEPEQIRVCAQCEIDTIAISPDGKTVAAAGDGRARPADTATRAITLWDTATGGRVGILEGHTVRVFDVQFSLDGSKLASASGDQTARLWDIAKLREAATMPERDYQKWAVAFSPDGKLLATGGLDGVLRFWDVASAREIRSIKAHTDYVNSIAFSPDGSRLASGAHESVVAGHDDAQLKMWDVATGQELPAFREKMGRVNCVRFSPDGKLLASGNLGSAVRIRDAMTGKLLLTFQGNAENVFSLAFSPDSRRLATAGGDHTIKIWDVTTGQELLTLEGHSAWVRSVTFSSDGKMLVSGSFDGTIRIWRAAAEDEVRARIGR